jgi:hypothetical protein
LSRRTQEFDRVFALISIVLAKLVEQASFAFFASAFLALAQHFQLFVSIYLSLHFHSSVLGVIFP